MIISKQNSPEEEAELRKLKDIEKCVEQMAKKLEKVDGELTGLKNVSNHRSFCFLIIYRKINITQLSFVPSSNVLLSPLSYHRAFSPKTSRQRPWVN